MARIVCNGYGTNHTTDTGRPWFACSACRWSSRPPSQESASVQLARQIAALDFALAGYDQPLTEDLG